MHTLTGTWAPDLLVDAGDGPVRLAELTKNARPLLLDLTQDASLAREALPWSDRVDAVTAVPASPEASTYARAAPSAATPPTALLLRPDCYLAWVSSSALPDSREREELRAAMVRWLGQAVPALSSAGATGR